MKLGVHFYALSLSLTLNNTSTSLGGYDYLETLNPTLLRFKCKFFKKNLPNFPKLLKIKKIGSHN